MLNSNFTRLLSLLVLGCAPLMAAIPPEVELGLEGAKLVDYQHYAVLEGDRVTLNATADAGDYMIVFAAPIRSNGFVAYADATMLMVDKSSSLGKLSGDFIVPKLAGHSFMLLAIASNAKGESGHSNWIRVDVLGADDGSKDLVSATGK